MIYSAFGLSLEADWPIPGLLPHANSSRPDISVRLEHEVAGHAGGEQLYDASEDDGADVPALRVWTTSGSYRLRYADGTQFIVDRGGQLIRVIVAGSTLEDAATYLLGPVLGFAMRLRGTACLHASVVAIDGEAIAIAGPAGAGKSTTAACFAAMGYPVLSDDIAALADRGGMIHVEPAYPQLRLWPDSVAMLYGEPDALPRLTPTWDKRGLLLSERRAFQRHSLPLGAVYVLDEIPVGAEPVVDDLSGSACLLALLANTYVGYLLDRAMRHQEFEGLSRLASTTPVRRLTRPVASVSPVAVCQRILEDCESLRSTTVNTIRR